MNVLYFINLTNKYFSGMEGSKRKCNIYLPNDQEISVETQVCLFNQNQACYAINYLCKLQFSQNKPGKIYWKLPAKALD